MSNFPFNITSDDIDLWSRRPDARVILPQLIRRLIDATNNCRINEFRTGSGTSYGGWDGKVFSDNESQFCAKGASGWELTVENKKAKLDEDFKKRTDDPDGLNIADSIYVAVTAKKYREKEKWKEEKHSSSDWRKVILLDAEDIAHWLEFPAATTVGFWFSRVLGKPCDDGIKDIEYFLTTSKYDEKGTCRKPSTYDHSCFQIQTELLLKWLEVPDPVNYHIRIFADSIYEALSFVAVTLDENDGEWKDKALIISNQIGLESVFGMSGKASFLFLLEDNSLSIPYGIHRIIIPFVVGSSSDTEILGNVIDIRRRP